jgi:hypothetical protein
VGIRNLYHGLAVVVLAAGIVGCGGAGPSGSAGSAAPSNDPLALRYTCGRFNFGPEILSEGAGSAERDPNPAAEELRRHLALPGPETDFLPDTGWILLGIDATGAEFGALDGDLGMKSVSVENGPNGWKVGGWGECQARIVLAEGLGPAEWHFDPGVPVSGPETQVFDALVTEMTCASGRPADGRIVGPEVVSSGDVVLVMFAVRPLPGGQDCPSNPSTRVTIDLGEPLGDRALLDGGRLPHGDPTQPRF